MKQIFCAVFVLVALSSVCQNLQPGFNKSEYRELVLAFSRWNDSAGYHGIPESKIYKNIYRAKERGLLNCWEMYEATGHSVISIRGTRDYALSWMANFHAAMIPAKGQLKLGDSLTYDYHFANNEKAGVHVGWAASCGFLVPDVTAKVLEQYQKGVRDFIIFGHSQGAAVAFLMNAQLKHYQTTGKIPKDIRFKTYCSAAPKPGNLYFSYDYEADNQFGWSFTVVNGADWVPELPVSIQSIGDFNKTNPFKNVPEIIQKRPILERPIMEFVYSELTKYNHKAVKKYQTYLGHFVAKAIGRSLKGFEDPEYLHSNYYVRCGTSIVLNPDEKYYQSFPDSDKAVLVHHNLKAYLYLLEQLKI